MKIDYFIGIVPPEEYLVRIVKFQSKWFKHSVVEPHITLKAQGGLTPDKKWINKVQKICYKFKPFQVLLDKPKYFGDNILYLSVISNNLHKLHQEIIGEISPSEEQIKQYFELDAFVPHLTLGKIQYDGGISDDLSKIEFIEMENLAEKELAPYPDFEVNFIRVYKRNIEKQRYEKYLDISLTN